MTTMKTMIAIEIVHDGSDEDDTNGNAETNGNDGNNGSDKNDLDDTHGNDRSFYHQQHRPVPLHHGQRLPNRLPRIIR